LVSLLPSTSSGSWMSLSCTSIALCWGRACPPRSEELRTMSLPQHVEPTPQIRTPSRTLVPTLQRSAWKTSWRFAVATYSALWVRQNPTILSSLISRSHQGNRRTTLNELSQILNSPLWPTMVGLFAAKWTVGIIDIPFMYLNRWILGSYPAPSLAKAGESSLA
jgi:hypothetical protein